MFKDLDLKFIKAGAGTGKTYSLTQELVKKVKDEGLDPSKILVTTFTIKAAQEIRDRVTEELVKNNMADQANKLGDAYIGTVNSVCHRLLEKFKFELELAPDLRLIEKDEEALIVQGIINECPNAEELKTLTEISHLGSLNSSFSKKDKRDKWVKDSEALMKAFRINGVPEEQTFIEDSLAHYYSIVAVNERNIEIDKAEILRLGILIQKDNEELSSKSKLTKSFRGELTAFLLDLKMNRMPTWKKWNLSPSDKDRGKCETIARFEELTKTYVQSSEYNNQVESYIKITYNIAVKALRNFESFKAQRGLIDYVDQEEKIVKLLDNEDVLKELEGLFDFVMVDEFQDTSPIQLKLFLKLAQLKNMKSVWVGDIKQAIYGFRGTDPALINSLLASLNQDAPEKIKTLSNSYRTRDDLMQKINKFFAASDQAITESENGNEIIEETGIFEKIDGVRSGNELSYPSWEHWHLYRQNSQTITVKEIPIVIADNIERLIERKLDVSDKDKSDHKISYYPNRPMEKSDIAVLCRSNDAVSAISKELIKRGIEVSSTPEGIYETEEVKLALACVKYCLNKFDKNAKNTIVLLTKGFADTSEFINQKLKGEIDTNEITTKLEEFDINFRYKPFEIQLKEVIGELDLYGIAHKWGNGNQAIANIDQLLLYVNRYVNYCMVTGKLPDIYGMDKFLAALNERSEDFYGVSSSKEAVHVMTYHKAKGLEWPIVILADLYKNSNEGDKIVKNNYFGVNSTSEQYDLSDLTGNTNLTIAPWMFGPKTGVGTITDANDNVNYNSDLASRVRDKGFLEDKRLLYVGMTRARDLLITLSKGKMNNGVASTDQLHWLNNVFLGNSTTAFNEKFSADGGVVKLFEGTDYEFSVNVTSHDLADVRDVGSDTKDLYWYEHKSNEGYKNKEISPSKRKLQLDYKYDVISIGDEMSFISTNEFKKIDDAEFGDFIHNIFEIYKVLDGKSDLLSEAIGNWGYGDIVSAEDLQQMINNYKIGLSKIFGAKFQLDNEVPAALLSKGLEYNGYIDVLVENDQSIGVVDHKTFKSKALIKDKLDKEYAAQLFTYKEMLESSEEYKSKVVETYLHLPLLGCFVKVEFS